MCAIFRYNYTEVYVSLALRIHYATKVESRKLEGQEGHAFQPTASVFLRVE